MPDGMGGGQRAVRLRRPQDLLPLPEAQLDEVRRRHEHLDHRHLFDVRPHILFELFSRRSGLAELSHSVVGLDQEVEIVAVFVLCESLCFSFLGKFPGAQASGLQLLLAM